MNQIDCFKKYNYSRPTLLNTGNKTRLLYYGKDMYSNFVVIIKSKTHITIKVERLKYDLEYNGTRYLITKELSDDDIENISTDLLVCMTNGRYHELNLTKYGLEMEDDI